MLRGQLRSHHAVCKNHACRGALKACRVLSREGAVLLFGYWRQLRYGHAECESHACCGVRMRAAPSSEGSVTGSLRWGQLQCGHFVCGSHACRGAWMCAAALSGTAGRIRTLGACSGGCHVLRESKDLRLSWPGCVLRLLREVQDGAWLWSHSPGSPCPVRQSADRNQRQRAASPSGDRS